MLNNFENKLDYRKGNGRPTIRTKEGPSAILEAIEFISQKQPVKPLKWSQELSEASKSHVLDIGPKGLAGHESSINQMSVKERLSQFGNIVICYGESLAFNCIEAKEVLIDLIIDDGCKS